MNLRFVLAVGIGLSITGLVSADENVRDVEQKLRDDGFYSGEIDGAYSSQLSEALTQYQTSKGLPATGQLDVATSDALDAKPAVTKNTADPERSSKSSSATRSREQQTSTSTPRSEASLTEEVETSSAHGEEAAGTIIQAQPRSAPAAKAAVSSASSEPVSAPPTVERTSPETTQPASAPATAESAGVSSTVSHIRTERLRDYVGAFVHAGLDPDVGSEADFFADRVRYYDEGVLDREQIRNDLQQYAARWPERHFWFAGNITMEPEHRKRVRVTFPLRYELRNGNTYASGTIIKTLVVEPASDDLQIVAVNEEKPE